MIGIYKITSPTNKVYIGQSVDIERRRSEHRSNSSCPILQNSIKKHGFENHKFEIVEECLVKELNTKERYYQEFYNSLSPNGLNANLVNTSEKKLVHTEEAKEKMSKANLGKKRTAEQNLRNREVRLGKKLPDETRLKMSKKHSRGKNPFSKKVINTVTGEVFDCMTDAAESISMKPDTLSCKLRGEVKNNTNFKYCQS